MPFYYVLLIDKFVCAENWNSLLDKYANKNCFHRLVSNKFYVLLTNIYSQRERLVRAALSATEVEIKYGCQLIQTKIIGCFP